MHSIYINNSKVMKRIPKIILRITYPLYLVTVKVHVNLLKISISGGSLFLHISLLVGVMLIMLMKHKIGGLKGKLRRRIKKKERRKRGNM
jgi:hypothetical protein